MHPFMDAAIRLARFFPEAIRSDEDRIFLEVMVPAAQLETTSASLYDLLLDYRKRTGIPIYRYYVTDGASRRANWILEQLRSRDGITDSPECQLLRRISALANSVREWVQSCGSWNWNLVFDDEDRWQDTTERLASEGEH